MDIYDGVEYNAYPPPRSLIKVMERRWAEALITNGTIRFRNLNYYRKWENPALGDPNDGEGMFCIKGHQYNIGSSNPVYAWCTSLSTISSDRILELAKHGQYDCVIIIQDPLLLIKRIKTALIKKKYCLHVHCAQVIYNREAEVSKEILNAQEFHFNVFQKSSIFSGDLEYRISLTDVSLPFRHKEFIDLQIGSCCDIMSIDKLQTTA